MVANPPGEVHDWDVPVLLANLNQLKNPSWDLTLQRLLPHIDGISSVRALAKKADVDLDFAREALKNLSYYSAIMLIDLFQFSFVSHPQLVAILQE